MKFNAEVGLVLSPFTTNPPGKLNVFRHDGHPLCMDSTKVCVFKETNKVGFCSFLQCKHCMALETQISLEVLGDFTHQPLKWKLADEKLRALLILANFSESN
ncbi:hypothetical protein T12_5679, partial [Trichinella patagoniensis]